MDFRSLYAPLIFLLFVSQSIKGQDTIQATYFAGDIPTSFDVYSASCNGPLTTLSLVLPEGDHYEVTNVHVEYSMTALGSGLIQHQRSKIRCSNNGNEEIEVEGVGGTPGTMVYSRDISVANGIYPGGTALVFEMWARRTFEGTAGCNSSVNRVNAATWTVTVYVGEELFTSIIAKNTGYVGMGTTEPATRLHLFDNQGFGDLTVEDLNPFVIFDATQSDNSGISFREQGAVTGAIIHDAATNTIQISGAAESVQPHLVVTQSGRVGIGTTSPSTKFTISSTDNLGDIRINDNFPFITLNATDAFGNSGIAFEQQGSLTGYIIHRAAEDAIYISGNNGSSQPHLVVKSNGRVGIGTGTPSYPLHMTKDTMSINGLEIANLGSANLGLDGDIVPYGGSGLAYDLGNNTSTQHWDDVVASEYITYSDDRVKDNVAPIDFGLDEILQLDPVQYQYKRLITPDDRLRFGLMAQDVEKVIPNLVVQEDIDVDPETGEIIRKATEFKAINYSDIIPVLIKSIQEQQQYIKSLELRITQLEGAGVHAQQSK